MSDKDALDREWILFREKVDPFVYEVVEAIEPWDAYNAALAVPAALADDIGWLPHGGAVYAAWAGLADLFEAGKTSIDAADDVLRHAAADWLSRSSEPVSGAIEAWVERAMDAVALRYREDGDFWQGPTA